MNCPKCKKELIDGILYHYKIVGKIITNVEAGEYPH